MPVTIKIKRGLEANVVSSAALEAGEMAIATDTGNVFISSDGNDNILVGRADIDTLTNQPSASALTKGNFFYATDSEDLYVDTGGTWNPISGGIQWSRITANTNAEDGNGYMIDASSAAVTLTLPASPNDGDEIGIVSLDNTHGITIARNGNKIQGNLSDMNIDLSDASFTLIYNSNATDWRIFSKLQESSTPVIVDAIANIPTTYISGRLFYATDENKLYVDDGSAWQDLFKADTTTGGNVAGAISVTTNGIGVKIDNDTIGEDGSNQLEVIKVDGGSL